MKNPETKLVENYFPPRKLESRGTQVDGRWVGIFRRWHEDGALFTESEYVNGQLNGMIREWAEDGLLVMSATVKDGEFDGPFKSWWNSGLKTNRTLHLVRHRWLGLEIFEHCQGVGSVKNLA